MPGPFIVFGMVAPHVDCVLSTGLNCKAASKKQEIARQAKTGTDFSGSALFADKRPSTVPGWAA
jgi:hypothetical protein